MIFETHAHYDDEGFDEDRDLLLMSMQENKIGYVINVGASLESTRRSIELAEKYPFVYASAGVHPSETAELNENNFEWLRKQCVHRKVVAPPNNNRHCLIKELFFIEPLTVIPYAYVNLAALILSL